MVAVFYAIEPQETVASLATSITASLINLVVILILSVVRIKIIDSLYNWDILHSSQYLDNSFTSATAIFFG